MKFEEPIEIRTVTLRNRLAKAPLGTYLATDEGLVTAELCDHYRRRAEPGRLGLVIVEHTYVAPEGKAKPRQASSASDACLPGLARLAEACHAHGTVAFCQLSHAGGAARQSVSGLPPVAPSPIVSSQAYPAAEGDGTPLALDAPGIARIVEAFAAAARRAREAGFDGVEIHSAHGYLLDEFYSPLLNKRTDEYGGSLEGRLRIHREVLAAARAATGPDFVIGVRLGGCDYEPGGATIEDAVAASRMLEDAGADYLSISGGWHAWRRPGHTEPGWFSDQSSAVRAAVGVPVLTAGGVKTLEDAERLLAEGSCNIVGVGRPLLADPDWPQGADTRA